MGKLKNEFSWSKSRNDTFRECKRKYYYSYYGHWGGWEFDAPEDVRQIYILGKLKNRFMWAGEIVHNAIKNILEETRMGRVPFVTTVKELTRERMRYDFESSKNKRYWQDPKSCALFEHEYDVNIVPEKWENLWKDIELCIDNFYNSEIFQSIRMLDGSSWLSIEELRDFLFEGTKVNVKLDFAYRERDGGIVIIDWKTGKSASRGADVQLGCYTLFAMGNWNVPVDKVRTIEYNLHHKIGLSNRLLDHEIEEVRGFIRDSIGEMKAHLVDPQENIASPNDFARTTNRSVCGVCNFKRICFSED